MKLALTVLVVFLFGMAPGMAKYHGRLPSTPVATGTTIATSHPAPAPVPSLRISLARLVDRLLA